MAKLNASVDEFSPAKSTDETLGGSGDEEEDDGREAVEMLNAVQGNRSGGLFQKFLPRRLGGRESIAGEPQGLPENPDSHVTTESNGITIEVLVPVAQSSAMLPASMASPTSPAKRKASSQSFTDWEVPDEPEDGPRHGVGNTVSNSSPKSAKNSRVKLKLNESLLSSSRGGKYKNTPRPKQSLSRPHPNRSSLASGINPQMPNIDSNLPSTTEVPANIDQPAKRKRGRPPKQKYQPAASSESKAVVAASSRQTELESLSPERGSSAPIVADHAPEDIGATKERSDVEDQIDSRIENPSPIKVSKPRPKKSGVVPWKQRASSAKPASDFEDRRTARENTNTAQSPEPEVNWELEEFSRGKPPGLEVFQTMLAKLKDFDTDLKNTNQLPLGTEGSDNQTVEGYRLEEALKNLTKAYLALRVSEPSGGISEAQVDVTRLVDKATEAVRGIRLWHPEKGIKYRRDTEEILTELYSDLLPSFIKAIKTGIEAYTARGPMTTVALHEIANLLDLIYSLADRAVGQPSSLQPKAFIGTYKLWQPISQILPMIKEVHTAFLSKLDKICRAQELIQIEKSIAELERQRQSEERARLLNESKTKEIHRLQNQVLKARLADPNCARWVKAEMERAKDEARFRRKPIGVGNTTRTLVGRHYSERTEHDTVADVGGATQDDPFDTGDGPFDTQDNPFDTQDDPFDAQDDPFDGYERVRVFGKGSRHQQVASKPWSKNDKTIFVDTLRLERGRDRYAKAAERLERSLDEVFEHAKDLQEAMDLEHENGRMNQQCDDWTYDIWVERR